MPKSQPGPKTTSTSKLGPNGLPKTTIAEKDAIVSRLDQIGEITCRPMMGEYLLYCQGTLFGGIYNNRLLIKITPSTATFQLPEAIPYPGAKPMYHLTNLDNPTLLHDIILAATCDLAKKKTK